MLAVAVVALASPAVLARPQPITPPPRDAPGNPLVLEGGRPCFEALGSQANGTTSCAALWAHVTNLLGGTMPSVRLPPPDCAFRQGFASLPAVAPTLDNTWMDVRPSSTPLTYDPGRPCEGRTNPGARAAASLRVVTTVFPSRP